MKKLIFFLLFGFLAILNVNAQSTTPRFGITPNSDNTGRVITYSYKTVTDAAGADSVTINTSAYQNLVKVTMTDSLYFKNPVVTKCAFGDQLILIISGSSGTFAKFATTNFVSTGTATLSSKGKSIIRFIFDGAKWVESSRVTQ